jgi:peptidoglycan/xylan/chitin deacetylase (PgdA/CDA1 family)
LLSRRDFLKELGIVGSSLVLSATGLLPQGLANPGVLTKNPDFSRIPLSESDDDLAYGDEDAKRIAFLAGHEIQKGDGTRRTVLMTYDDQGHRVWIDQILDAYKLARGKASFFFTGESLALYAKQIQRIVAEGHVFGCHGFVHEPHTAMGSDEIRRQTWEWLRIVEKIIPGYRVKFFRFPYGDRNERVRKVIAEFGLQSVHWNIESGGLDQGTFNKVVDNVFAGSIVLSHMTRYYDVYDAEKIVKRLKECGYSLESLETGRDPRDIYPPEIPAGRSYYTDALATILEP